MFIIHRMSSSTSTITLSLFSKPSTSILTRCFSLVSANVSPRKPTYFSLYNGNHRNGFCSSSSSSSSSSVSAAVASTDSIQATTDDSKDLSVGTLSELRVKLPTNDSSQALLRIRHTCAHVMAMAVQKLYPNAKVTIGPWIDNGFYYDFDMDPITDKDLKRIKKEMERIIGRNFPLVREEVTRDEAHRRIAAQNEPYKLEILDSIKEEPITIYHIGDEWWDLCAGPHVESTGTINRKAIELESVAGAYWRGDVSKPMLQRIYGTAWENEEQLKAYLHFKEEALRRDHRRLGQDLDLFSIQSLMCRLLLLSCSTCR